MRIFGVDPGLSGGWAVIVDGRPTLCGDLPVVGEPPHRRISGVVLAQAMTDADLCVVELTWPRPTDGVAQAFRFGSAFGTILGAAGALSVPIETVSPQTWKASFRLTGKDKEASRAKAIDLAPHLAESLCRKRDHGRAEAILIGIYGARTWGREPVAA